jgi:hypothetical protein
MLQCRPARARSRPGCRCGAKHLSVDSDRRIHRANERDHADARVIRNIFAGLAGGYIFQSIIPRHEGLLRDRDAPMLEDILNNSELIDVKRNRVFAIR